MGFAVAADEVRNLAQRCAQAARDTASPIADSIAKSGDGQSKLALVAGALGSITESAARVKSLVDEVSSGGVEPSRGIEQVAKAIVQNGKGHTVHGRDRVPYDAGWPAADPRVCDRFSRMRILLAALLATTGAFAQKVSVEFDPAAPFPNYHTFAIRDGQINSRNPALNSELVKKRIDADIANDFIARGLSMVVGPGPADLNLRYTFGAARGVKPEAYPAGWRGWGTVIVREPFAEGTLVIDLRDPTTHSLVWRAIATVEKSDLMKVEGKIDSMVEKSVKKYPPKP
jgi:hypothetical protein